MFTHLLPFSTLVAALGCGLIAGVFFAFSVFIMRALAVLPPPQGIAAMQSINIVVIHPMFLGVFLGTAIVCAGLAISSLLEWSRPGSGWMLAGAVLYIVGTLTVTMVCNVPRNNLLAALDPASTQAAQVWAEYVRSWTAWNTVRTIASLLASTALVVALWLARIPEGA